MKDPRVGFATITRVETSRDLGHAQVWVSVFGTDDGAGKPRGADRRDAMAAPPARGAAALRHVPQLSIRADDSIESGDRVLRILREIEAETAPKVSREGESSRCCAAAQPDHGHLPREPGRRHAGGGDRHRDRGGADGQAGRRS